jgi:chemotaxis protein MotB
MAKRRDKKSGGVPEWVVTYGDMMSLLLCFFILLASLSELKDDEIEPVLEAIREAFGQTEGQGFAPMEEMPLQSVIEKLEQTALYREEIPKRSVTDDPGVDGRDTTVTRVREGLQFTVGGLITFEPGSAELKPQAREALQKVGRTIQGQNNKIEIRGHAAGADLPADSPYNSLWDLSFARARAAADYLTGEAIGVDPRRLRLVGCGDTEPLVARVYDPTQLQVNRRVEVIVTESLVQDFEAGAEAFSAVEP